MRNKSPCIRCMYTSTERLYELKMISKYYNFRYLYYFYLKSIK